MADNLSKTYGTTYTFNGTEFTTEGLTGGDTVTSVTLTSSGASAAAVVGTYPVIPSNAVGTGLINYNIVYIPGIFTVIPEPHTSNGNLFTIVSTGTPAEASVTLCLNGIGSLSCENLPVFGLNLSISTTVPNHFYPAASIMVTTPGYVLANPEADCAPSSNGRCLFSVSNTQPQTFSINNVTFAKSVREADYPTSEMTTSIDESEALSKTSNPNNPSTENSGETLLRATLSDLALSVKDTALNPALTGRPRQIKITNTGSTTAMNVTYTKSSLLPTDAQIIPASCGDIAPAATCVLTISPGSIASAAPYDTSPKPIKLTIAGNNTNTLTSTINILTYGSVYESGYIFSIDDTTPSTVSIGGKIAALFDQASPYPNGVSWMPTKPKFAVESPTDLACNPMEKDSCSIPRSSDAAGRCKAMKTGYTDWYLPSICEMGPPSDYQLCNSDTDMQNIVDNLPLLLNSTCTDSSCLSGYYWSSVELSSDYSGEAWAQFFAPSSGSHQNHINKINQLGVRCIRAIK